MTLIPNKIVFKEPDAAIVPWNQTVCQVNTNILAITGNQPGIILFDMKSFKTLVEIEDLDYLLSTICLKNKLFCGSVSGEIYEFDYKPETNELKFLEKFKIHDGRIFSITKTSSGELVTTSEDGTIKFWKIIN